MGDAEHGIEIRRGGEQGRGAEREIREGKKRVKLNMMNTELGETWSIEQGAGWGNMEVEQGRGVEMGFRKG